jgi:hypothetical protein
MDREIKVFNRKVRKGFRKERKESLKLGHYPCPGVCGGSQAVEGDKEGQEKRKTLTRTIGE